MVDKINNKSGRDSDADGLSDAEEELLGTNPFEADTDHDAVGDYQETKIYGTDPLNPDTDQDGCSDGQEIKAGANPRGNGSLKDLFIPHEGNCYKPRALEPKRLFFHALAAATIKVVVVAFLLAFPIEAWMTPDILVEQGNKIVALTNNLRVNLYISPLSVSDALVKASLTKAQDMLVNQYFAHVSPDKKSLKTFLGIYDYKYKVAGENLALGFSSAEEVVKAWEKSPTHYSNLIDPEFTETGVGVVAGKYEGYDTTLVAQFFGTPKPAPIVEPIKTPSAPVPAPINEIAISEAVPRQNNGNLPVITQTPPVNNVVLGQELKPEPLQTPKLITPVDNFISAKVKVTFSISAPRAESVAVFDNDKVLFSSLVQNDSVFSEQNLSEGQHKIIIKAQKGQEELSSVGYNVTIDTVAPQVDQAKTFIAANETQDRKNVVIRVEAYLSNDTKQATVSLAGRNIELFQDFVVADKWTGHLIIAGKEKDSFFDPVISANLIATDQAGNMGRYEIDWQNVVPTKTTVLDQYAFLKATRPLPMKSLFDISYAYYKTILLLAIVATLLNIFIKIRKQHAHIIISSLAFVLFVGLLIAL